MIPPLPVICLETQETPFELGFDPYYTIQMVLFRGQVWCFQKFVLEYNILLFLFYT